MMNSENSLEREKFRISIIDFIPQYEKFEVGKDVEGKSVYLGSIVENNGDQWFVAYRYGRIMLKQPGIMAMIGNDAFDKGDFSSLKKLNICASAADWLIIGYTDEPMYERLKGVIA